MYENAQWVDFMGQHSSIQVKINGITSFVPLDPANTDYQNIMKLVEDGELEITPAENTPIE